jgi:hypothetical protein
MLAKHLHFLQFIPRLKKEGGKDFLTLDVTAIIVGACHAQWYVNDKKESSLQQFLPVRVSWAIDSPLSDKPETVQLIVTTSGQPLLHTAQDTSECLASKTIKSVSYRIKTASFRSSDVSCFSKPVNIHTTDDNMLSIVCPDDLIIVNACGGPCRERYSCFMLYCSILCVYWRRVNLCNLQALRPFTGSIICPWSCLRALRRPLTLMLEPGCAMQCLCCLCDCSFCNIHSFRTLYCIVAKKV